MVATTKIRPALILLTILFIGLGANFSAHAADSQQPGYLLAQKQLISKNQAIAIAKRRQKGKVLSAQLVKSSPPIYKVKMLTPQGRVKFIRVIAYSKSKG